MEKINKICACILILISFIIGFFIGHKRSNKYIPSNNINVIDTTYNKVILDSIDYNIKEKDSIIIKLKQVNKYEMEKAINANDSDAIKQFIELAGS